MAEINIEKKSNPWPWIIGLLVLALLVWGAFEMMDNDRADNTAYAEGTAVVDGVDAGVTTGADVVATTGAAVANATGLNGATRVFFPLDQAELTGPSRNVLDQVANDVRGDSEREIVLAAYTDTTGTRPYNEALSARRGEAVRQYLVSQGVAADRITIAPHGQSDQLVETADGVRAAANRRVTVSFGDEL